MAHRLDEFEVALVEARDTANKMFEWLMLQYKDEGAHSGFMALACANLVGLIVANLKYQCDYDADECQSYLNLVQELTQQTYVDDVSDGLKTGLLARENISRTVQ